MDMNNTATILGISEEVTTCECCGKSNLKRTVALNIDGAVVYYGCDCAAKAYRSDSVRNFNAAAVKELGRWANLVKRYGEEAVVNRYGRRNLELAGVA